MKNYIDKKNTRRSNLFINNDYVGRKTTINYVETTTNSNNKNVNDDSLYQNINFDKINQNSMKIIAELMNKTNKNNQEANILSAFMRKSNELMIMIKQVNQDSTEDLLLRISLSLKHKFLESSRVIFKYGSKADVFYIILYGSVDILIPKEEKLQMTEEEYIKYLLKLKKYDELELLNKTINANKNIYRVDEFISSIFSETPDRNILAKKKSIRKILEKDIKEAIDFINSVNKEKEGYISSSKYIENLTPEIYDNKTEKNLVTVYKYFSVINLKQGSKFGDVALDSPIQKRTATIITLEDTHLGILHKSFYEQCIKSVNEKIINNHVNFICSTKLFSNINKYDFHKNYFNYFAYEKVLRNTKLIEQGEEPSHVYILKSGEYEVYFKKSISQINDLISSLGGNIDIYDEESDLICKVKSEKKYTKLSIIKDFDIIGLDDCIINNSNIFTVECTTNTGEIYKIQNNLFKNICEKEPYIIKNIQEFIKLKKKFYLNRIEDIKDNRLRVYDDIYFKTNESNFMSNTSDMKTKVKNIFIGKLTKNNLNNSVNLNNESFKKSYNEKQCYDYSTIEKNINNRSVNENLKVYTNYTSIPKKSKLFPIKLIKEYNSKLFPNQFNYGLQGKSKLQNSTLNLNGYKLYKNILKEKFNPSNISDSSSQNDIKIDLPKKLNVIDCLAMDNYDRLYNSLYSSPLKLDKKNILKYDAIINQDKSSLEGLYSKQFIIENKNIMNMRDSKLNYSEKKTIKKKIKIKPNLILAFTKTKYNK